MKLNKKVVIILVSIIIILSIIATIAILMNNRKSKEFKETAVLSEFINKEDNEEEDVLVAILENEQESVDIPSINNEVVPNENEENNNDNNTPSSTYDENYYIKVNNQANVVTIYKKDSSGNYTIPVKSMVCSVGTATPKSGVYSTTNKYQWRLLIGNVYGQYATRIVGSILFHSVPYLKQDPSTLEYWEYDKLGTAASAGCVRLTVADAKWIYDNCKSGTKVEFYSDSNPGPLGKPTAQKISNADDNVREWDPTDPRDNNPWKTYNSNKVEDTKNNSQTENQPKENNVQEEIQQKENNTIQNTVGEKNEIKREESTNTVNNVIVKDNNTVTSNKQEETNVMKNNINNINKID